MVQVIPVQGGAYDSNIFLVMGSKTSVLIDAGTGFFNSSVIDTIKGRLDGSDLDAIILTHEHIDHSGGAPGLRDEFDSPIYCSRRCADALETGNPALTGSLLFGITPEPMMDLRILGSDLRIGDLGFEVHDTPGHCRGQVGLIDVEIRSLFCGDMIFCDGGLGRWDLPGGDLGEHQESIRRSLDWEVRSLHPGHGRSEWTDPADEMRLAYSMIKDI